MHLCFFYSFEIWGFEILDIIERVHFFYYVINLKSDAPSYMVYKETGRFLLYVTVYTGMVCYWTKLFLSSENKIVCILYRHIYDIFCKRSYENLWLPCIHNFFFNSCRFSNIRNEQALANDIFYYCLRHLKDQFIQKWQCDFQDSSKGEINYIFKN